jgi:hypothetical protein
MNMRPDDRDRSSRNGGSLFDSLISLPTALAVISVYMIFLITYLAPDMKDWGIPAPIFIIPIAIVTIAVPIIISHLFGSKVRRR